jgi:hypothetical protein
MLAGFKSQAGWHPMDVVCCDIRVVSSRKRRGERVGVGSRGKYPGAPPHHKGKRNQADRKRYLIGLLGEKGKAKGLEWLGQPITAGRHKLLKLLNGSEMGRI